MRDEQKTKAELLRELKTLRESEEQWRSLVENALDIIVIADPDGTVSYINHTVSGIAPEKVVGTSIYDYVPADQRETLRESLKRVFQTAETDSLELVGIGPDGTASVYESHVGPIRSAGRVIAASFIAKDITERKKAEKALAESEETARALMNAVLDTAVLMDTKGTILAINETGAQRLGRSVDEIVGKNARHVLPSEVFEHRRSKAAEVIRTGKTVRYEDERAGMRFDTCIRPVRDAQGKVELIAVFARDITRRKQLEQGTAVLARFPDESPNPILRISEDCRILYANRASSPVLETWRIQVGQSLPEECCKWAKEASASGKVSTFEFNCDDGRTFLVTLAPVAEEGYLNAYGLDITEHKTAEQALRENEERMRLFMDSATEGFTLWDSQFNLVRANKAVLRMFPPGTKEEDLIGKNALEIVPDLRQSGRHEKYMEVMKTGIPLFFDDLVPHSRFGDRRIDVKAFRVGDGLGLITTDVTEHKKTLARDEMILKTCIDGFWLLDTGGRILEVNDAYCRMSGYSRDDLLTMSLQDVEASETPQEVAEHIQQVTDGGAHRFESRHRRKDGTIMDLDISAHHLGIDGGRIFTFLRDITEHRQVEDALRRASIAVETSLNAVFSADLEGRVIYANPVAASMWGFDDPAEMVGTDVLDYWAEEHRPEAMRAVETLMKEGSYLNLEGLVAKRNDGTVFFTEVKSSIVKDESGNPVGMVGSFVDITHRRKAEEAVRESEEKYRTLVESAGDSIATVDDNGVFLFVNNWAAQDLGGRPEDFVGKTMWDLFPKEIADRQAANVRKVIDTKQGMSLILSTEVQGQSRWYSTTIEPLRDSSGRAAAAMIIARDVTGFKTAEEELERY
ncbi:MAG: PAS domain S-box protein, partial [Phycisphaerales bacterium]